MCGDTLESSERGQHLSDGSRDSADRRRARRTYLLALILPVLVTFFSQFEFVQKSSCVVAELPWGVGRCEVMADLIAPMWALAIIPLAGLQRRLIPVHGRAPVVAEGWFMTRFGTERRVVGTTWAATWGALLIIVLSYTREWERFNQQPGMTWYSLVVLAVLALLLVPVWWMREAIHERGVRFLEEGSLVGRLDRYLFSTGGDGPVRWPHLVAFAAITIVVTLTVLGQFNSLLLGMNLPGAPSSGIGSLASVFEFDLGAKTDLVLDRVAAWREYTDSVGARFGSAYAVAASHVLIDSLVMIPAYVGAGLTLMLLAWRNRTRLGSGSPERRSYELINLSALFLLVVVAVFDVLENVFTWYVMDRAWRGADLLTEANVRMLWFFSFARLLVLALLFASGVLLLALGRSRIGRLVPALVAVRSEIVVVGVFAVAVLVPPQTADVIRGWRVSHTLLTLALVMVLSLFIRWSSATTLRLHDRLRARAEAGEKLQPRRVRIPVVDARPTLGSFVAGVVLVVAAVQILLTVGLGAPLGRGLIIPAAFIVALWVLGLAMPAATYLRGDREISEGLRRRFPRLLGSAVYVVIGIAVLNAAVGSVAYARHEDWYLLFALVPPGIGMWRIHHRTTHQMRVIEPVFTTAVVLLGTVLLLNGNPELSPAAMSFAGVTYAYGSLAYFNSYEPGSIVSELSTRYLRDLRARPVVTLAALLTLGAVVWVVADPIGFAPRIGSVGVLLLAILFLALLGAASIRLAELSRPPKILSAFRIKRTPVLSLIVAWLVLAPTLAPRTISDISVLEAPAGSAPIGNVGFDEVFSRWRDRNPDPGGGPTADRPVLPMILVSSSGGGIRAAVWTSYVLDCIFETTASSQGPCANRNITPDESRNTAVAIMSGVSGGALGLASYSSYLLTGGGVSDEWVAEALGDDYLASALGWLMFVDLPRSLIGFGSGISNRSDIMERSWENSWPDDAGALDRGIAQLWHAEPQLPPFIMNGTSVNDACRFNASIFDVDGDSSDVSGCADAGVVSGAGSGASGVLAATYDLTDFLCIGDDVRLSTAVSLSARFPVVSSTARVAGDPASGCRSRRSNAVYVVDGGYLEGSGAGTLLDSWDALAGFVDAHNSAPGATSCIVPFMVHIDNGYESPSSTPSDLAPREFLVPLVALVNAQTGRITSAREEAAIAFDQRFTLAGSPITVVHRTESGTSEVLSRYTRLVTRAHPGVQAPLGWTLSSASIDDLRDQLEIDANLAALAEVRSWLDGDLVCKGDASGG